MEKFQSIQLDKWLRILKKLAKPARPLVFIVGTHIDLIPPKSQTTELMEAMIKYYENERMFSILGFYSVNGLTGKHIGDREIVLEILSQPYSRLLKEYGCDRLIISSHYCISTYLS
jgi:hypothetical protein